MTLLSRHLCTRIVHKALSVVKPVIRLDLDDGVHGVGHWSRVWFHGRHLPESVDVNPAILAWFAYLHDSQRYNDHSDPLHGTRAADFALNLKKDRVITELDNSDFERLCEAMRLHSDGHTEADAAIRACWDADRLDLWRVGIRPDAKRLCTQLARKTEVLARANRMAQAAWM
jgi:uncharacterized protein